MKIKQKLVSLTAGVLALTGLVTATVPYTVSAATCAGVTTSLISCGGSNSSTSDVTKTGIWSLLILAINILTAGVGIAAIGGVVYGAVLYASARDSQEQVKRAVGVLTNVAIGVVAYALMWSGLNFLIPGGVFN